jgi:alpha-tubulin suppressor-like RCC1 family protein
MPLHSASQAKGVWLALVFATSVVIPGVGHAQFISAPIITQQPAGQAVVAGGTASFTVAAIANPPCSYQWTLNGGALTNGARISGATGTNLVITTVGAGDSGNYQVVLSNAIGTATSGVAGLNVLLPPAFTQVPASLAVAAGSSATLTVAATGTPPLVLQWYFNGAAIPGATNSVLTLSNLQPAQMGYYAAQAVNPVGATTSANGIITVLTPAPVITGFTPGAMTPGSAVTISGSNFSPMAGSNTVFFGATRATVTAASPTNLVVNVPAGATLAPITVTVGGLTAFAPAPFEPTFVGGSPVNSGSFRPRVNLPATYGVCKAVIADLDGDGNPDLLVVGGTNAAVSLYRNLGTGGTLSASSFAAPVDLPTGSPAGATVSALVADLDGDGKPDLIVPDQLAGAILVFRNISTPGSLTPNSFAPPVAYPVPPGGRRVTVADLDGDGRPDLIAASYAGLVSVLRNLSTPGNLTTNSFAPAITFPAGPGAADVAAGDLDGDGKPDLAVANSATNTVSLFRNLSTPGTLAFAPSVDLPSPGNSESVVLGDVDGDGKLDVVGAAFASQTLSVYINQASPGPFSTNSFAPRVDFANGNTIHSAVLADVNGDGRPDILAVGEVASYLSVYQNQGSPSGFSNSSLAAWVSFPTGWNPWGLAVGDLDGDGRPDAVFCNTYDGTVSVCQNASALGSAPVINTLLQNQLFPVGSNPSLNVNVNGLDLNYQWYFNGAPLADTAHISGAHASSLVINSAQTNDTGAYRLIVTNSMGSATSAVANVSILYPPQVVTPPQSQSVLVGTNVTFSVVASGSALTYQWFFNGTPLADGPSTSGSATPTLTLSNVPLAFAGTYSVGVANSLSATIATAHLQISLSPYPSIATQPQSLTNAAGNPAVFSVVVRGTPPFSYQWYGNGAPLAEGGRIAGSTNLVLTILNAQTNDSGPYQFVVTNLYGAATSQVAQLEVLEPPGIVIPPQNQSVLAGTDATFAVTVSGSGPFNYQWFFNGTPLADGPAISGSAGPILTLSNLQLTNAGTYAVFVTNAIATASASAALAVLSPPFMVLQPQGSTNAAGATAGFSATAGGTAPLAYQWYSNGVALLDDGRIAGSASNQLTLPNLLTNDSGAYQLVVTNLYGAATSQVAQLIVLLPPTILQPPVGTNVMIGQNAAFSVVAGGTAPLAYQWYKNNQALTDDGHFLGTATSLLTISNVLSTDQDSYSVTVSNLVGVTNSLAVPLAVPQPPTINDDPISQSVPLGFPASFSLSVSGDASSSYQWQLNGTNIPGATNVTYAIAAVGTNDLGTYHLTVTNIAGTATSADGSLTLGQVAAWGRNDYGQTNVPPNLTNVVMISAGKNTGSPGHNLALLGNGTVVAWGNNNYGQATVPASATNIVAVAAGGSHSLALRADGTVLAWGYNGSGQTNVPSTLSNVVALAAGANHSVALRSDGRVVTWGNYNSPANVPASLVKVVAVAAGANHNLAQGSDGTITTWGYGGDGLTNGPALGDVAALAAGNFDTLVVRSNGLAVEWGNNTYGQTNVPASLTNAVTAAAGDNHSIALRADGTMSAWGYNNYGQTNVPAAATNLVAVAAGDSHNLVLVGNGQPIITRPPVGGTSWVGRSVALTASVAGNAPLACQWLFNGTNLPGATNLTLALANLAPTNTGSYQLVVSNNLGAVASVPVPLTVLNNPPLTILGQPASQTNNQGGKITLSVSVAGNGPVRYQWQTFYPNNNKSATNLPGATNADLVFDPVMMTNAGTYSCLVSNASATATSASAAVGVQLVQTWGYLPTYAPTNITNAIAIAAGSAGTGTSSGIYWTLRTDGKLASWGSSQYSENFQPASVSNATVTAVAAGLNHTLALRSDGTVVDWGNSSYGLAIIPTNAVNVSAVACGDYNDLVLRADGTAVCWGNTVTNSPAMATNSFVAIAAGQGNCYGLRADGRVIAWGYGSMTPPASLSNVVAISAGVGSYYSVYALLANGTVTNWGTGNPRIPADWTNIVAISSSANHVTALRADGTVATAGTYYSGTATVPPGLSNVIAIASGGDHDVALFGTRAPAITIQPFSQTVLKGATNFMLAGMAVGVQPVSYQWQCNGQNLPGATNNILTFPNPNPQKNGQWQGVQLTNAGAYQLIVSNRYGIAASKAAALVVSLPLGTALDATNLTWTSSGAAQWFGQTNTTHDGVAAAQSGSIGNSQQTTLQTLVAGPGQGSFWWKVSSETFFDVLDFRVNGVVQTNISGAVDWQQVNFTLTGSSNTLQWVYTKDPSTSVGQDAGWVDQFTYLPNPPVITYQPPSLIASVSNTIYFSCTVTGASPVTFQWVQNTNSLLRRSSYSNNTGNPITDYLYLYNVGRSNSGVYSCTISNAGGSVTTTNFTLKILVPQLLGAPVAQPGGGIAILAGDVNGGLLSPSDLSNFEAQVSLDLHNWTSLTNGLTLTNGMLLLQDPGTNQPDSFYRIIEH